MKVEISLEKLSEGKLLELMISSAVEFHRRKAFKDESENTEAPETPKVQEPKRKYKKRREEWNQQDIDYLKENYGKSFVGDVCKHLGRSYYAVTSKAKELNLQRPKIIRDGKSPFTVEEIAIIKKEYKQGSAVIYIADRLERPYSSVSNKIVKLGLSKQDDFREDDEEEIIEEDEK